MYNMYFAENYLCISDVYVLTCLNKTSKFYKAFMKTLLSVK